MSSPTATTAPTYHHHPPPTEVHSPSNGGGFEKRRKLNDHLNVNDQHHGAPPPMGHSPGGYHHHHHHQPPHMPPQGYYGAPPPPVDGSPGAPNGHPMHHHYGGPPPYSPNNGPPPPHHAMYGQAPPHHHEYYAPPPPPHYAGAPGNAVPPSPCHVPKERQGSWEHHHQMPNGSSNDHQQNNNNDDLPPRAHLPPRFSSNNQYHNNTNIDDSNYDHRPGKQQLLQHHSNVITQDGTSSPGPNNNDASSPTEDVANTLDTRSPEGSRNLNTLEERQNGSPSSQQHQQQTLEAVQDNNNNYSHEQQQHHGSPGNNAEPPTGIPAGMPPPPPGMQWQPAPPGYGPPPMPPSPHQMGQMSSYPPPPPHQMGHGPPHPHHPGMPPPQFMSPHGPPPPGMQHPHSPQEMQQQGPPPPGVMGPNGEMAWPCGYCNIKFTSFEDCSAHESTCPAAAYHHHQQQQQAVAQYGGAPPMYVGPPPGAMMSPRLGPPPGHHQFQQFSPNEVGYDGRPIIENKRNGRSTKGRRRLPSNVHVDENAEYATNNDRVTYLLSTPMDADSLSDRQCYVRSHFVELFISNADDVQARHSRGAQKLNVGQVGMRCAYCAKLKPRDRAERAVCYPSSISRIYQTVADMQRFHFESCIAIPPKVLHMYKTLKTTRPRGVGSPQSYWDRSAHEIGLMDTEFGIQAVSCNASEGRDDVAASGDEDIGRLTLQKKSLVSGMLERLDNVPGQDNQDMMMMMPTHENGMAHHVQVKDEEVTLGKPLHQQTAAEPQRPPAVVHTAPATPGGTKPAPVVSSPGSENLSKDEGDAQQNSHGATSSPKEVAEAEDDANILLMLKKTQSPKDDGDVADKEESTTDAGSVEKGLVVPV